MAAELTAGQIMTREVQTIPASATLEEAARLLIERDITGAPVVDEDGNVVGIVSESDLMSEAKREAALPHIAAFGFFLAKEEALQRIYHGGRTLPVEGLMSRDVVTVTEEMPVQEVADLLVRRKINRVPVLRDGKLVGIITREDVLRGLFGALPPTGGG